MNFFWFFLSNGLSSGFLSNASYASIEMIKCFFFFFHFVSVVYHID